MDEPNKILPIIYVPKKNGFLTDTSYDEIVLSSATTAQYILNMKDVVSQHNFLLLYELLMPEYVVVTLYMVVGHLCLWQ